MYQIKISKTWHGRRYSVVDPKGNVVETKERLLIFPYTPEGLKKAKEAKSLLKKSA